MIIESIVGGIIDLVLGKAGVALKPEDKANLQMKAMELARDSEKDTIDNLNKQAEINVALATNGKLGWRNFLCWILTLAVLYQIVEVPLIVTLVALLHMFGMSYADIIQLQATIRSALPIHSPINSVEMLMGLCGMYGWRGHEKLQYSKMKV